MTMAKKTPILVSLVVPCKNEENNVTRLVSGIDSVFRSMRLGSEIIMVDDNSTDRTGELIDRLALRHRNLKAVHRRDGKCGVGRAFRDGFRVASGDYVMTLDSDFSHDPQEIASLVEGALEGHDLVIGSRYTGKGRADMPLTRQVISRSYSLLGKMLVGLPLRDLSTGFRLIKRSLLKKITIENDEFDVHPELNIKLWKIAKSPIEVPIYYRPRSGGKSKFKYFGEAKGYIKTLISLRN